ncbi:tRNA (adenosine(37)-N6)-dimethylallyltransferase MiaA [Tenacibaculum sp. TC6]|uniref:tRNA (adenosine(37)-N6)-dimethylallyltransferase MiaA n=1 Tax=Tenacibaculum sp. TC6 TaxID=3423223 RepID=UPI003D365E08
MTNTLITIVGPTAIGKTALGIKLAQHFGCDILSCDSRQFYKEMSIGTAVPNKEELEAATHHFIQNRSIFDDYNVGQFERDALATLDELFKKNPIQIMVGGSGLYVDAVLNGLDDFPDVDPSIRSNLTALLASDGIETLQKKLASLDIEAYNTIAIDNPHRLIRALEICIGTGKTYSSFKNKPKAARNFNSIKIGLTADRELMYNRINKRVDIMMDNGLLTEAKEMYPHKSLNALQTVGYRELFDYFDGHFTLDFAIEEIKKNTRRFAKRQGTWFRKDTSIIWFDFQENTQHIIATIEAKL